MSDNTPQPVPQQTARYRFKIPETIRQRVLLAHLTPARMTELFNALEAAINKKGLRDAAINVEYTRDGEVYNEGELLPSITFGLRKVPASTANLVLPPGA
jgi:hypothetical protein